MSNLTDALAGRVAFVSSGNAEQDERTRRMIIRSEAYRSEGLCPNGCAPLEAYHLGDVPSGVVAGMFTCPSCGYVEGRSTL